MKKKYCPTCSSINRPFVGGSIWITIIGLFLYVLPGILYEVWRNSPAQLRCGFCHAKGVIPVSSPRAMNDLNRFGRHNEALYLLEKGEA